MTHHAPNRSRRWMEINAPVRGASVWWLEEQPGVSRTSKNSHGHSFPRNCVAEVFGSATSGIFPSRRELSGISECPGTPKTLQHLCGFFFRMDTLKSQGGPGVLDLHSQSEEKWIKCFMRAKKKVCSKINPSLCHSC